MKALTIGSTNYGPFNSIEVLSDRYRCDNTDLPFVVVGQGEIVEADTITWPEPPVPPTPVPESVSPRQIRQAMTQFGIRQLIEDSIAGGGQNAKDWYEYATAFERNHPLVLGMAQALSITEKQLDDLWILAGSL
jgi:hypothetical protein